MHYEISNFGKPNYFSTTQHKLLARVKNTWELDPQHIRLVKPIEVGMSANNSKIHQINFRKQVAK